MLLFYKSIPLHKHILQIALLDIRSQKNIQFLLCSQCSAFTPLSGSCGHFRPAHCTHRHTAHTQTHTHSVTQTLTTIKASCPFNINSLHTHMLSYISLFISFFLKFFFCSFLINFEFLPQIITCKRAIFFVHIPWKQMWLGYMYMCIYTNRTVF